MPRERFFTDLFNWPHLGQLQQQDSHKVLQWIPGQTGIPGNKITDDAAKPAMSFTRVQVKVLLSLHLGYQYKDPGSVVIKRDLFGASNKGSEAAREYSLLADARQPMKEMSQENHLSTFTHFVSTINATDNSQMNADTVY